MSISCPYHAHTHGRFSYNFETPVLFQGQLDYERRKITITAPTIAIAPGAHLYASDLYIHCDTLIFIGNTHSARFEIKAKKMYFLRATFEVNPKTLKIDVPETETDPFIVADVFRQFLEAKKYQLIEEINCKHQPTWVQKINGAHQPAELG